MKIGHENTTVIQKCIADQQMQNYYQGKNIEIYSVGEKKV